MMKRYVRRKIQHTSWSALCLLMTSVPIISTGQNLDSLIAVHTNGKGKVNIEHIVTSSKNLIYSSPDKAAAIGKKMIDLSKKQNEPLNLGHSHRFLGAYYADAKGNWDSAYIHYKQAERLYHEYNWGKGEGAILHNYGTIETQKGNYMTAITFYTEALRVLDDVNDTETIHKTFNNLSFLYAYLKNFEKAEIYARKCVDISRRLRDELTMASGNLSLIDALLSQNKVTGVTTLLDETLKLAEKNDIQHLIIGYYFNYGKYYAYHTKEYDKAITFYKKSLELSKKLSSPWHIIRSQAMLAYAYYDNNQFEKALVMAHAANTGSIELQTNDLQERALIVLARSNAKKGNFESAYNQLDSAYVLRDTLFKEENLNRLELLETEYQTEKKELQITALEKQRQLYTWLGIAGFAILLIAFAFGLIRYRLAVSRRKLAEEETQRIQQEKQLVAVQATLDGETAERSRLAKDLHDGLGGMLSAVKMNLPQVKGEAALLEAGDVSRFQTALGMLDDSIQELRRVAHHMMPESLLRYGLKVSLADFCAAIPIADFHYFGNEARLPEKLEIIVYRCIHELVNNALKHAEATKINVQLVQEPDRLSFTVQDDGKGYDRQTVSEGMGLRNIRQRVDAFQGEMNIYSTEKGTEVHVELELSKNEQND